jgi:hypothetical protein
MLPATDELSHGATVSLTWVHTVNDRLRVEEAIRDGRTPPVLSAYAIETYDNVSIGRLTGMVENFSGQRYVHAFIDVMQPAAGWTTFESAIRLEFFDATLYIPESLVPEPATNLENVVVITKWPEVRFFLASGIDSQVLDSHRVPDWSAGRCPVELGAWLRRTCQRSSNPCGRIGVVARSGEMNVLSLRAAAAVASWHAQIPAIDFSIWEHPIEFDAQTVRMGVTSFVRRFREASAGATGSPPPSPPTRFIHVP